MLKSASVLAAAVLLLAACGPARDPAYVCMTNCAHYCPDGISGDECRHNLQLQAQDRRDDDYPDNRLRAGYVYGDAYYYGTPYPAYPAETVTTTTYTTRDYPY